MCRKFFLLTSFLLVFVFAFSTMAMASDIAFYVGQWNTDDWYDETQFADVETIIAETGHLFNDIQQFDDTQFDEFGAWVDENTNDGEMDIIWLNGCTPSVLYPNPNEQPDGSRAEEWLDGGNMIINVGDWFAYCTYEGGPRGGEGRGGDNGGDGAANILDLTSGIIFGADGTQLTVTPTGKEYLPSLNDPAKTDRPVALSAVEAPWEVAAIFASPGGTDDPAAEAHADPVVIHNTETGGYVAFINQASGGPDGWIDDRGLTSAEFIGNWVNDVIGLGAAPAAPVLMEGWQSQDIGTTGGSAAENCGTWIISADGADVWGSSDEFHYAYVSLSGDGEIVARVVDNGTGSNGWAKGGVMIRETLDADSKHALMALTGGEGGGMGFQNRQETGGSSFSSHGDPTAAPPYWVKLTRVGNTITGYSSADGVTWVQQPDGTGGDMTTNPVEIEMAADVYIGIFVTSHASGEVRTYTFDNVGKELPRAMDKWEVAVAQADPGFLATNVEDGLYDIGEFSGDITYEFCVLGNPDETEASMCLIGRRQFGDTQVGLKYEQWNNTGTYGATVFGVVDLDYGVPTAPGFDTHLVFVSSEDMGTTKLYVNGVLEGSVDSAIPLSGLVGIGYGAQGEDGSDSFDNFDGDIFGVAIYDMALSDEQIAAHSDAFFEPLSDVTAPGDIVQGVPNDGEQDGSGNFGWPGAETPDLAIDDDTSTKFLHFKGELEPTGFQVTPLDGATIVTGLTFTTANDAAERDPIAFELSGSNESIDGPYELIASGDIVDFAQADAWPRFTMNATPILFDNDVAYAHYQVLFPAVRDAGSANSMQIAEVELLRLRRRCENIGIESTCATDESKLIYSKTDSVGNRLELRCDGAYNLCFIPAGATTGCIIGHCSFPVGENVGWVCYDPWGKFTSVTWLNFEGHVDPKNPASAVDDNDGDGQEDRDRYIYDVASGIRTKTRQERTLKQPSKQSDPGNPWVSKTTDTCICLIDCPDCAESSGTITFVSNVPRITPVRFVGSIQGGGQVVLGIHGTQVVVPTTAGMDVQQLAQQTVDYFNLCWQGPQVPSQSQSQRQRQRQRQRQQQTKSATIDPGFGQVVLFHNVDEQEISIRIVGEPELTLDFSAYPD